MSGELYFEKWRKARKEHTCTWCQEKIEKGETYHFEKLMRDGEFWEKKLHGECWDAWREVRHYFTVEHGWESDEDESWGRILPGGSDVYKHPRGGFYWGENSSTAYEMINEEIWCM